MLNVLKKNEMENIVAIVTRYFGGIKLGAGGLVRAYSKSVLETLSIAEIVDMELYEIFRFSFEYQLIKTMTHKSFDGLCQKRVSFATYSSLY